jgi:hypothetical protein
VAGFITQNFVPVKIHVKEQPDAFKRFGAQWTPTLIVLDPEGKERYRFEGYLPPEDFIAQLQLGLAKSAFARGQWDDADRRFLEIARLHKDSEVAPEAVYWAGVSLYKRTSDHHALGETAKQLRSGYPESIWTKKASVWEEKGGGAG